MTAERTGAAPLEERLAAAEEKVRRLEAQLRNLADHDPLTDLRKRQSLEHAIEEHLSGCVRYGPSGAVVLIGLDGLDDVTRTLGHGVADELRVAVAEGVVERLRSTDLIARWGTDELAVLLPRASRREVQVVGKALLGVVAGATAAQVPPGTLSASIGVAFVVAEEQMDELVVRASMSMLAARRAGGGKTMVDGQHQSQLLWLSRNRLRSQDGPLKAGTVSAEAGQD